MSWTEYKIKEIVNHFQNGYAFNASNYTDVGIPIISMQSISLEGKFQLNEKNNCWDEKEKERLTNFILKKGDLIMSMTDVTPQRNLIGCSTIINREGVFFLNQRVGKLEANENKVDVCFLDYYFKSNHWRNYCRRISSLSVQANIGTRDILNGKIKLPPKPEQTAIATILSKVDEAIAATQNSIKAAEKLKKALMQNLLTGKLKPNGTWRTEDEFYEDEKFGRVPKGWEVKSIDDLVNRKKDTIDPVKSNEIFDYVGLEHIAQGEFLRIGKGKSDETLALKVVFDKGDLLYGKLRPYLNKVWIADISGVGSTEFLVFEKNEFTEWIYLNLQTKRFLDFTLSMTAGTQHPRASWRDVKRYLIIKPSDYSELQIISNKILATEKDKLEKQTKIQTLQRLKKSLMQNLLTGKVRLPQAFIEQFENVVIPKPIEQEN